MKPIVFCAVLGLVAGALVTCLDTGVGSADAAEERSCCGTVSVHGVIGEDGSAVLTMPVEASPDPAVAPLLSVYRQDGDTWIAVSDYSVRHGVTGVDEDRGRVVTVYDEPGTSIVVVALRMR